ncbi:hypothetical protein ACLOJK_027954 [Asimina triloba]
MSPWRTPQKSTARSREDWIGTRGNSVVGDDEDDAGAVKKGADRSQSCGEEIARCRRGCEGEGGVHCSWLGSEAREIIRRLVDTVEEERFGARIR